MVLHSCHPSILGVFHSSCSEVLVLPWRLINLASTISVPHSGLSSELADARSKAAQLRAALDEAHAHTARFREVIDARARRQRETERDRDRERSWLALVCMALE